jgi:hypothetical protein
VTLRLVVLLAAAVPAGLWAEQQGAEPRPRDAAEAVREGDVSQWLKYYQRERELQTPAQPPAPATEPATQQQQEDAAAKR